MSGKESSNDIEFRQGEFKNRNWFSTHIDEPLTKFVARNFFGLGPGDNIKLMDGTIVPMSLSGTNFSVSETNADIMTFCATSFLGIFGLAKSTNFVPNLKNGDTVYRVYGGDSLPGGASWTTKNPSKIHDYRNKAGLPSGLESGVTNSGQFVIEGVVTDSSQCVLKRKALPLDGNIGGLNEYIIPNAVEQGAIKIKNVSGVNPPF